MLVYQRVLVQGVSSTHVFVNAMATLELDEIAKPSDVFSMRKRSYSQTVPAPGPDDEHLHIFLTRQLK